MSKRPESRAAGKAKAGMKRESSATGATALKTTAPKTAGRAEAASGGASRTPRATGAATPIAGATANGPDQTRGRVVGYTVGRKGLIVQLDCSAISRIAFSVGPEEPHFRSAVSMAMVALNNRVNPATTAAGRIDQQYLWVWLEEGTENQKVRPASVVAMSVDTGNDPFDIDGFVYTPDL